MLASQDCFRTLAASELSCPIPLASELGLLEAFVALKFAPALALEQSIGACGDGTPLWSALRVLESSATLAACRVVMVVVLAFSVSRWSGGAVPSGAASLDIRVSTKLAVVFPVPSVPEMAGHPHNFARTLSQDDTLSSQCPDGAFSH